jgi:hypothetical protein
MKDTLLLRFYFTLHIPKVVSNDINFFEASLKGTYRGRDIDDAYTVGGKKNGSGGRIESSSLFDLVSLQPDFVNEVTLLQYFTEHGLVVNCC